MEKGRKKMSKEAFKSKNNIIKRVSKAGKVSWAIRYTDTDGVRRYESCSKWSDADARLSEVKTQIRKGEYRPPSDLTLGDFADKWLAVKKSEVRPGTYNSYKHHLKNQILPFFGSNRKIRSISTENIEQFKADLSEKTMSPATASKHILTLSMMLKVAVIWKHLTENPAQFVKRPRHDKPEMEFITPSEMDTLILATAPRYQSLIMTACYSGARKGELLGLKWKDIRTLQSSIKIERTLQQGKLYKPKNKSSQRLVKVPGVVIKALEKHKSNLVMEGLPVGPDDFVFVDKKGMAFDTNYTTRFIFKPALMRAEIRHIRFHDLRHSYAAKAISDNRPIKWIQRQLGHSSIQITLDTYGHLLPDIDTEAAIWLDQSFGSQIEGKLSAYFVPMTPQNTVKNDKPQKAKALLKGQL